MFAAQDCTSLRPGTSSLWSAAPYTQDMLKSCQLFLQNTSWILDQAIFILYLDYWSTLPLFRPRTKNIFPLRHLNHQSSWYFSFHDLWNGKIEEGKEFSWDVVENSHAQHQQVSQDAPQLLVLSASLIALGWFISSLQVQPIPWSGGSKEQPGNHSTHFSAICWSTGHGPCPRLVFYLIIFLLCEDLPVISTVLSSFIHVESCNHVWFYK